MNVVQLETSFTLVSDTKTISIDYNDFADQNLHFIILDDSIASDLRKLSMREGASIEKYDVGGNTKTKVEFYRFNLKKDKKAVKSIKNTVYEAWKKAIDANSQSGISNGEQLFQADFMPIANKIEHIIEMRRFLSNAFSPNALKKTKRMYLLFHHAVDNALTDDV